MGLYEKLKEFQGADNETALAGEFNNLAKSFLYGGYIKVGHLRIYLVTVEFYFHCEDGSPYDIKDPIVYHKGKDVEYFPIMYLNPHISGYDITFENKEKGYRASVLIREYAIYDEKAKSFRLLKNESVIDDRVSELKNHLEKDGLSLKAGVWDYWVDEIDQTEEDTRAKKRRGVKIFENGNKTTKQDPREWGFRRNNVPTVTI